MGFDNITYENATSAEGGLCAVTRPGQESDGLRGAQLLGRALRSEGVDIIFGYPGGANLEIFDVLREFDIKCIRTEHEQGAIHAAQGYARVSGRVGVCLATSGPGATNLVTGIADANSDSTPIVAITGNVPSHLLGRNAFQEVDIVAITQPITKRNYLVRQASEIPAVVREAFSVAAGGRPGPVLIDIPKDIQQQCLPSSKGGYAEHDAPSANVTAEDVVRIADCQLEAAVTLIRAARRPVIYAGGGVIASESAGLLLQLAEKLQCPVTTTLMGHGAFPPDHPLALHSLGMHGSRYANVAINEADLVIALGVRFDDRVTGHVESFIAEGKIIHIDIDRNELNKNKPVTLAILADLRSALEQLLVAVDAGSHGEWIDYLDDLRRRYPFEVPESDRITPQAAIALLSEMTCGEAIVSLGVGQHQMWAMQHYRSRWPRRFLSSSGFGTMGYGLPAAIGAKVAAPEALVLDIDGDGSLNMTIHELATCRRYGIGVKVVVINNQWLGMVRQWQDMVYQGHRSASDLSDPMAVKIPGEEDIYPDFPTIAAGYRVRAERVSRPDQLRAAFERLIADPNEPYVLDVIVDAEENVYPMIPAGGSYRDIIMSAEDLTASGGASTRQGANI